MDVFEAMAEFEIGGLHLFENGFESLSDEGGLLRRQDTGAFQRPCVYLAAGDVDFQQLAVEADGGVEACHQLRRVGGKSTPEGSRSLRPFHGR